MIVLALPLSELAALPKAEFQEKNHHQPKFYLHAMHETNYSKDVPISKHPFILKRTEGI